MFKCSNDIPLLTDQANGEGETNIQSEKNTVDNKR